MPSELLHDPRAMGNYWFVLALATSPEDSYSQARMLDKSGRIERVMDPNFAVVAGWALRLRSGDAGLLRVRSSGYSSVSGTREPQFPALTRRSARQGRRLAT